MVLDMIMEFLSKLLSTGDRLRFQITGWLMEILGRLKGMIFVTLYDFTVEYKKMETV